MKALLIGFIISILAIGFSQPARADFEDGDIIPESKVAPLMAWVEGQTGVRVPALPRVIASHTRLSDIVSSKGRISGRARAVFVAGTVVLDDRSFDLEDDTQVSLLVHELVHYAQSFKHNAGWACPQSKEVEAYTLQNAWLAERDHGPFVRASWIQRMSSCPSTPSVMVMASQD